MEEFKLFAIIALYFGLFLGSFTLYRRLIVAETGAAYLHYGIALVQALVIAKVILIGNMFAFTRRYDDRPLIVPVLYKSMLFISLVLVFGVIEHVVEGLVHKQGFASAMHDIAEIGAYEIGARVLMLFVAFVPFFAFAEVGAVMGPRRLAALFFGKREARGREAVGEISRSS